ncbi:hypothetical protein [Rhizobium laguerreae]|uniref:hypothetical protein n=1 Tax=Rhizobium laguerreae TaxID=1076926 RepID=UPI001C919D82|nr:hypothetical protein [Rhizobium laguerreae]MBY3314757.1 hypothetical protein [Rhizobium laguerreae]
MLNSRSSRSTAALKFPKSIFRPRRAIAMKSIHAAYDRTLDDAGNRIEQPPRFAVFQPSSHPDRHRVQMTDSYPSKAEAEKHVDAALAVIHREDGNDSVQKNDLVVDALTPEEVSRDEGLAARPDKSPAEIVAHLRGQPEGTVYETYNGALDTHTDYSLQGDDLHVVSQSTSFREETVFDANTLEEKAQPEHELPASKNWTAVYDAAPDAPVFTEEMESVKEVAQLGLDHGYFHRASGDFVDVVDRLDDLDPGSKVIIDNYEFALTDGKLEIANIETNQTARFDTTALRSGGSVFAEGLTDQQKAVASSSFQEAVTERYPDAPKSPAHELAARAQASMAENAERRAAQPAMQREASL